MHARAVYCSHERTCRSVAVWCFLAASRGQLSASGVPSRLEGDQLGCCGIDAPTPCKRPLQNLLLRLCVTSAAVLLFSTHVCHVAGIGHPPGKQEVASYVLQVPPSLSMPFQPCFAARAHEGSAPCCCDFGPELYPTCLYGLLLHLGPSEPFPFGMHAP